MIITSDNLEMPFPVVPEIDIHEVDAVERAARHQADNVVFLNHLQRINEFVEMNAVGAFHKDIMA